MSVINNVEEIPRIIRNKKQALRDMQRQTIFIADSDHDYIQDEIERPDHIEYERQIHDDNK